MNFDKEQQQRDEFCAILYELAKSQDSLQDASFCEYIYGRLENLYGGEIKFRHYYSDIFSVLTEIQQNESMGDINTLAQNITLIYEVYQQKDEGSEESYVKQSIRKLYDHVSLDCARINYSDSADRKISGEKAISDLKAEVKNVENSVSRVQESAEEKIANQQKEYIAILGIFAAVVLAFTGGLAFSTSVLENIAHASAYRTVLVSLIIGLVLVNILCSLFYFINRIVNNEKRFIPLIVSNGVIVFLIAMTLWAWDCGFIESRNDRINQSSNNIESVTVWDNAA